MNIALIGYGRMGRTIEALGKQQGIAFPLVIDLNNSDDLNADNLKDIDVAIEFSIPESAPANILACIDLGVPVVSGTTGWNERFKEVTAYCNKKSGAFLCQQLQYRCKCFIRHEQEAGTDHGPLSWLQGNHGRGAPCS